MPTVKIPSGLTRLEESTFSGCEAFTEIVIPAKIEYMGLSTFGGCSGMTDLTILNPECGIGFGYQGGFVPETVTIHGYADSTAQGFANRNGNPFVVITDEPKTELPADLDGNSEINASDAAILLTAAAASGTGADTGLTEAQIKAADLNADGAFDAKDASLILMYAAYVGSGGELSITEYLATL
jgi:hypothetical protein